ncbi:MAG: helix-turn-helix transcriptional regulator [Polyangiales bacterium]
MLAGGEETERVYSLDAAAAHPLFRPLADVVDGREGASRHLATASELSRTTLARQHLRGDGTLHGLSAMLLSASPVAAVHVLGGRRGGPWTDGAADRLQRVTPTLRRAVEVYARLRRQRSTAQIDEGLLDALDVAALAVTSDGRIQRANASARSMLARSDGVLDANGALRCVQAGAQRSLQAAVDTILRGEAREAVVIAPRRTGRRPLLLFVSALTPSVGATPTLTVLVRDPESQASRAEELLRSLFSLTPAEARLALAVADGCSPADAAEQLGITVQTARTHLKRVFHKTATTRQAELVKLVLAEFPPVA